MNYNELNRKLEQIKIEDFIWIIYIGIIALSFYSNSLEEKYYLFNDNISKEKYRKIMIFIFSIPIAFAASIAFFSIFSWKIYTH